LSSLQRSIARQESCILWRSEGDATKFFHVQANVRRHRKHIRSLQHDAQTIFNEDQKVVTAFEFFQEVLGMASTHSNSINHDRLNLGHNLCPSIG
jgi:hypothetical protein